MAYRRFDSTLLTWTGVKAFGATEYAPDGSTIIDLGCPDELDYFIDTSGAVTGAPDFTFKVYTSLDGANWSTAVLQTIVSALAKNLKVPYTGTLYCRYIKVVCIVGTANLAATEHVDCTVVRFHKTIGQ